MLNSAPSPEGKWMSVRQKWSNAAQHESVAQNFCVHKVSYMADGCEVLRQNCLCLGKQVTKKAFRRGCPVGRNRESSDTITTEKNGQWPREGTTTGDPWCGPDAVQKADNSPAVGKQHRSSERRPPVRSGPSPAGCFRPVDAFHRFSGGPNMSKPVQGRLGWRRGTLPGWGARVRSRMWGWAVQLHFSPNIRLFECTSWSSSIRTWFSTYGLQSAQCWLLPKLRFHVLTWKALVRSPLLTKKMIKLKEVRAATTLFTRNGGLLSRTASSRNEKWWCRNDSRKQEFIPNQHRFHHNCHIWEGTWYVWQANPCRRVSANRSGTSFILRTLLVAWISSWKQNFLFLWALQWESIWIK